MHPQTLEGRNYPKVRSVHTNVSHPLKSEQHPANYNNSKQLKYCGNHTEKAYHSFPCEGFSSSTRIMYNKQLNNLREKLNKRILRPLSK